MNIEWLTPTSNAPENAQFRVEQEPEEHVAGLAIVSSPTIACRSRTW